MGHISYHTIEHPIYQRSATCSVLTWKHAWTHVVCRLAGVKAADCHLNIHEGVNVAGAWSCRLVIGTGTGCVFVSLWPFLDTHTDMHTLTVRHTHTHNRIIWEWKSVAQKGSRAQGWRKVELVSCWSKPVARGDASHRRQCCNCTAWWDLCLHNNFSAI